MMESASHSVAFCGHINMIHDKFDLSIDPKTVGSIGSGT